MYHLVFDISKSPVFHGHKFTNMFIYIVYVDKHICKFVTTEYRRFQNIKYKMIHILGWTLIFLIKIKSRMEFLIFVIQRHMTFTEYVLL